PVHAPETYSITNRLPTGTEKAVELVPTENAAGVPTPIACALAAARAAALPTLMLDGGTVGFVTVTGSGVLTTLTAGPPCCAVASLPMKSTPAAARAHVITRVLNITFPPIMVVKPHKLKPD